MVSVCDLRAFKPFRPPVFILFMNNYARIRLLRYATFVALLFRIIRRFPSTCWSILSSQLHRILLWHSAFPLSAVFAKQARPGAGHEMHESHFPWFGIADRPVSPVCCQHTPTAYLIGKLKPPPGRASCQDGFRYTDPPSFACRDAQVPRNSSALFAVPSGRDGRGRKH